MQPAATKIKAKARIVGYRPGPPAKPRTRFNKEALHRGFAEPPRGGNTGGARTDNDDFKFARHECPAMGPTLTS
jgi:hypothetical protein